MESALAATASLVGAIKPLVVGAVLPQASWISFVASVLGLGVLGVGRDGFGGDLRPKASG